jgi:endo-1,4-beta-xylanase
VSGATIGRRGWLGAAAALAAGTTAAAEDTPGLATLARQRNLVFGAAAPWQALADDPAYRAACLRESSLLVPEWELKWGPLRPAPDRFDFATGDAMRGFAQHNGLAFRGHALVWHEHMPGWAADLTRVTAPAALDQHITRVVGHYAGAMHSWDVVNEAIELDDGRADGLRDTLWLRTMGPGYIAEAFRLARQADRDVPLFYNDYGFEQTDRASRAKRTAVLRLLERLRRDGAPIDALGMQGHLRAGRELDTEQLPGFLRAVADLGLVIYVTEFDVTDRDLPADPRLRDPLVADCARRYLETVLAEPAVRGVITWGLSDRYTWLNGHASLRRRDGRSARSLPLDAEMQRKPLWQAMARAFQSAAPRS